MLHDRPGRGLTDGPQNRPSPQRLGRPPQTPVWPLAGRVQPPRSPVHRASDVRRQGRRRRLARPHPEIAAGTWRDPDEAAPLPPKVFTFGAYAEEWLRDRDLKPRTVESYRWLLETRIYATFADVPLPAITPELVRAWWGSLDRAKPTTRAQAYQVLRTIMATAASEDLITAQPCRIRGAGQVKRATNTKA